jgi:hypothetical protein
MNATAFASWLDAILAADKTLAGLISLGRSVRAELSSDDQASMDRALASIQSANDATYLRLDGKLAAAEAR